MYLGKTGVCYPVICDVGIRNMREWIWNVRAVVAFLITIGHGLPIELTHLLASVEQSIQHEKMCKLVNPENI